ncbi:vWA domain-containing protein [Pontibacter burrus]|uniref:STAS/SEC14 domain-containing protein n=1 Tax=Pontibacter burrus TaxID=2704466 RepID=A0A6B3LVJ8_9BACT|nr:hypothetical protein [Pontibacter burrus]NEM98316.1 hypothetical protein [Pontibacter burrus]
MILHKDGLFILDYDVASDILVVKWFASDTATSPELSYTMQILVEKVRSYDIKRLLIDAREDVVAVSDEEYVELNVSFAKNLVSTRLERVARLGTTNINRENFVKELVADLQTLPETHIVYKEFNDQATAKEWLQDSNRRDS